MVVEKELLGEILLKRGLIKPAQLQEGLSVQKRDGGLIGEILVRMGVVSEIDVVVALILQCNLPYLAINKYELNRDILTVVPADVARQCHVVPLEKVGQILSVVMSDPLNDEIREKLETLSGCKIAPFIATKSEIEQALMKYYP